MKSKGYYIWDPDGGVLGDLGLGQLIPPVGRGSKNKMGSHFYFSTGGIFIASVDPPSTESTDHGLMVIMPPPWIMEIVN